MRILLTGVTGLVGQGVLHEVLADASVTQVGLLGRRTVHHEDPRVQSLVVERFDALDEIADQFAPWDACFYCAGAPPVGTAEREYRQVTVDLTVSVARTFAERNPRGRFLYISGANANPRSRLMPLRIKGEAEGVLQTLPIATVMLRPGGVQPAHGERSPHAWMRPMYALGSPLMGLGVRVLPGLLTSTAAIGRTLLILAAMPDPPRVVENAEINRIAAGTQA